MKLQFDLIDWRGWDSASSPPPKLQQVPAMLRRRLSPLGRAAFDVALPLLERHGNLPIVFASRHGELTRTLGLLHDIARGEPLSPAAFSLSVHNAIAGVLSIQSGSHASINAIAAGRDDLAPALLEALGMSAEFNSAVLCVFADGSLPELYQPLFAEDATPFALALVVTTGNQWQLVSTQGLCEDSPVPAIKMAQSLRLLKMLTSGRNGLDLPGEVSHWRLQQL